MTIETAVYDLLKTVQARTYPLVAPQKVQDPFVIYTKIGMDQDRLLGGSIALYDSTFQIDAYAATMKAAAALAASIRAALVDHNGINQSPSDGIRWVKLEDERHMFDDTAEPALYRVSMDFVFRHE